MIVVICNPPQSPKKTSVKIKNVLTSPGSKKIITNFGGIFLCSHAKYKYGLHVSVNVQLVVCKVIFLPIQFFTYLFTPS